VRTTITLIIVCVIAALGWHYRHVFILDPSTTPVLIPAEPVEPAEPDASNSEPRHLVAPEPIRDRKTGEYVPLPPLDDSDAWFLLALTDLFGSETSTVFLNETLIDRLVATIDSLPRGHTSEKVRPVTRLSEPFRPEENAYTILLGPENFARYDALVARFASANPDDIVMTYRRFYPLFQESYERLGYPNAYFNDRVVEVIDHLLDTPEPDGPLNLTRPNVLFEFADPELEALSSGQKLLLRMGNAHALTMKQVMRELRARIVVSGSA
jgi:uncharacterized short protein YbdD (DUF466 family)